ncbi:MAG: ribosome biogenesis GTP-binding protein YihA/YsxC [Bacillota bacterium]|nr:ribosome biogenesis GTP-binding protein YihA/YsxC [Bacillota bacterium]
MKIKNSSFVKSATSKAGYPEGNLPELAFVGRSNVGKSSLLNMLLNRRDLAKTASTPGKTRLINFFDIDNLFRIVDLPGYGYAKVSKSLQEEWGGYIEEYLNERECLLEVFLLIDARRTPNELDKMMYEFIKKKGFTGYIFVTKMDKLKQSEKKPNLEKIEKVLNVGSKELLIPVSSLKRTGKYEAWDLINHIFAINRMEIHIERQVKA